ncbi:hypothetical protein RBB50_010239 [Rhinocladiella similis]
MPAPDTTPYTGAYTPQIVKTPTGPSLFWRFARSVFWADLFFTIGAIAGTALISWEYLQPPFESGSEEDQELCEEIQETLEVHPLVEGLREQNWTEENFYPSRSNGAVRGEHLVGEKLTGTRGVTMKVFKHPSQPITMMVFFLGFGVEGWPDTIHGGMTMSLLHESVQQHLQMHHPELGPATAQFSNVSFFRPMRPGDVYSIFVPPTIVQPSVKEHHKSVHVTPILMYLDGPISVEVASNWQGKSEDGEQPGSTQTVAGASMIDRQSLKAIPNVHAFGEMDVAVPEANAGGDNTHSPPLF